MEPHMNKVLLFVLAVGISNATALPIAHAMDMASFVTADSGKVLPYYAADYRRERRTYRHTRRLGDYPYYRDYASGLAAWKWPYCSYGSYVACVYTNAFCWQRCW
jgi:hypothetical protein